MSKIKFIQEKIDADIIDYYLNFYKKLGFELIDIHHYKDNGTSYSGTVHNGYVSFSKDKYDYYKCYFKFDMKKKTARSRWKTYKKYIRKQEEISNNHWVSRGHLHFSKAFIPMGIILTLIIFPFVPMLFDHDFAEFISWTRDLFEIDKRLDVIPLTMSILLAPITGFWLSSIIELISYAFTFKRRRLNAISKIPVLEKELKVLVDRIQNESFQ